MSCASVNCKGKNVSQTLRNRCCGKSVGKCAGLTGETLKQCQGGKSTLFKGKSITQRVAEGEKAEKRPPNTLDKVLDPSKQTDEEKEYTTKVPILLGGKPAESPGGDEEADVDSDCNDWGWLKFMCVGGKSATKGYNDCGGTGIPCGHLAIGVLAAILLLVVLPKIL